MGSEVICMYETWVEEKNKQTALKLLYNNHNWWFDFSDKGGARVRSVGGMIVGIRNNIKYNIRL